MRFLFMTHAHWQELTLPAPLAGRLVKIAVLDLLGNQFGLLQVLHDLLRRSLCHVPLDSWVLSLDGDTDGDLLDVRLSHSVGRKLCPGS